MKMLLYLVAILLLVWFFILKWKKRHLQKLSRQLKSSLKTLPLFGHSYLMWGNAEDMMNGWQIVGREAIKCGGIIAFWLINKLYIVIADPKVAEIVLKNCLEKDDMVKFFHIVYGDGSVFTTVHKWRPRRKIMTPTFNTKNLNSYVAKFSALSCIMVDKLKCVAGKGPTSMWKILSTLSLDAVTETTLGVQIRAQENPDQPFLEALIEISRLAAARIRMPWLYSDYIFKKVSLYQVILKFKAVLYEFVDKVLRQNREAKQNSQQLPYKEININGPKTFVDLMLESELIKESDDAIREECLVILGAASDSTAITMGFALMLLARYPEVQENIFKELNEVFVDFDRPVLSDDLHHLKYLDAVLRETLRLYPPFPMIIRKIEHDFMLPSGVTLLAGCGVAVNIWAIHRNPQYWGTDAEQFRPERFLNSLTECPAAFMAFSCGPRNCIGFQYAMMLMKTALATLLKRYRIVPASSEELKKPLRSTFNIIMRHVDNYCVGIEARK